MGVQIDFIEESKVAIIVFVFVGFSLVAITVQRRFGPRKQPPAFSVVFNGLANIVRFKKIELQLRPIVKGFVAIFFGVYLKAALKIGLIYITFKMRFLKKQLII